MYMYVCLCFPGEAGNEWLGSTHDTTAFITPKLLQAEQLPQVIHAWRFRCLSLFQPWGHLASQRSEDGEWPVQRRGYVVTRTIDAKLVPSTDRTQYPRILYWVRFVLGTRLG